MKTIKLTAAALFFLCACASEPNLKTGEGCEDLGLTGELRNVRQPAKVYTGLNMDELWEKCDPEPKRLIWGCYKPIEHEIYLYWGATIAGSKRTLWEEQCHSIGFTGHVEIPDWVLENARRDEFRKRYHGPGF